MNKKITVRVRNNISIQMRDEMNERLKAFIKEIGGPVYVSDRMGIPIGTIKSYLGSKKRSVSLALADHLCREFYGSTQPKFKREYLRPDVTPTQWQRLDDLLKGA